MKEQAVFEHLNLFFQKSKTLIPWKKAEIFISAIISLIFRIEEALFGFKNEKVVSPRNYEGTTILNEPMNKSIVLVCHPWTSLHVNCHNESTGSLFFISERVNFGWSSMFLNFQDISLKLFLNLFLILLFFCTIYTPFFLGYH